MKNDKEHKTALPELRFPEFRDSEGWKETLLKSISPAIFDGTHQTPKYTESGIPFYSVENIVSGNKNKFISEDDHKIATLRNCPQKGDILITRIGTIGFSKVVDWDFDFSIYVTLAVVKKSEKFTPNFLHSYFQSSIYQSEIKSKSLLNAVPCKINMDELRNTRIFLPPDKQKDEQKKIADCFSSLDDLISAVTDKIEALKEHKKGLMQQLFPQSGKTTPALRFSEFRESGEWVKKKLGKIAELTSSKRVHLADYVSSGVPFFRGKEISQLKDNQIPDDILHISTELYYEIKNKYGVPQKGDILITAVGTLGNVYCIKDDSEFYFKDGNLIWMRNISINSNFLEVMLSVNKDKILASAIGSSQKALTMVALNKLEFKVPKNPAEQQKIADCLSSIDGQIMTEQQKLDQLKAHKKGLMQRLFPKL